MQQFNYDDIYGDVINSKNSNTSHQQQNDGAFKNNHQRQQIINNLLKEEKMRLSSRNNLSIGRNTKGKKSEVYQVNAILEPNHVHPNHHTNLLKKDSKYSLPSSIINHSANDDPFHGKRYESTNNNSGVTPGKYNGTGGTGGIDRRMMRNQNAEKYQMDPRRTKYEMNPNAHAMFNSHNEQVKQNEYSSLSASQHIEPMYYDQTNYSSPMALENDSRMYLAESNETSSNFAEISGHSLQKMQAVNSRMSNNETQEYKQKRSYRNPHDEVNSNGKIWEHQFTPMATPQ